MTIIIITIIIIYYKFIAINNLHIELIAVKLERVLHLEYHYYFLTLGKYLWRANYAVVTGDWLGVKLTK